MNEIISKVINILKENYICFICLGRLFYDIKKNKNPIKLGKEIKKEIRKLIIEKKLEKSLFKNLIRKNRQCFLCNNLFYNIKTILINIINKLNFYEFNSFYVGISIPKELIIREDYLRIKYNILSGESLKSFFNKFFSKYINKKTKKKINITEPELKIIYDLNNNKIEIVPSSIYIYGRYIKNKRGIRQTKEYCNICKGEGCLECNYTGYSNAPSIESYVLPIFTKNFQAMDSVLHAAGREDIDVMTLNTGRPFVVEVRRPLKRRIDLKEIEKLVKEKSKGDVIIKNLKYVNKEIVKKITVFSRYDEKTYILRVKFLKNIDENILEKIVKGLKGKIILQRTPLRVLYRRKDKVRYKMIYDISAKKVENKIVDFKITCQGGLYIKELAHGDQGRTNPNISSLANSPLEIISLDIVSIAPDLEERFEI